MIGEQTGLFNKPRRTVLLLSYYPGEVFLLSEAADRDQQSLLFAVLFACDESNRAIGKSVIDYFHNQVLVLLPAIESESELTLGSLRGVHL
jgi:hypothetical protein